jgi:predicted small lipoprotein YifL
MKNAIITGIMAATILIAGCGKKSPSSSTTLPPAQADSASSSSTAQTPASAVGANTKHFVLPKNMVVPERAIVTRAKNIVLPEFKLDGVTLSEAVHQLQIASKQNDPESKGVNFMITGPATAAASPKVTLALKSVTLKDAIDRVAEVAVVRVSAQDFAFVFDAKTDEP